MRRRQRLPRGARHRNHWAVSVARMTACVGLVLAIGSGCSAQSSADVVVSLIDTGVASDLEQFGSYEIESLDSTAEPSGAHGTMMLSVILGINGDEEPLRADGLEILSFDVGPTPTASAIAEAIDRSVEEGADIVSVSLGVRRNSPALKASVRRAAEADVLVVAAAGNVQFLPADYPARYHEALSVSAVDATGQYWSQAVRRDVDTVALGVDVAVTLPDGSIENESGTSIAAAATTREIGRSLLANEIDSPFDYRPPSLPAG